MHNILKLKLWIMAFIFLSDFFIIPTQVLASVKIPFKTNKPIKVIIMLQDKKGNPVKAKITFWEYNPPFKIDQTFGLKWKDLDSSTIEQVYLGFELFETKEQYLSLYHGSERKFMEEYYGNLNFEEELKQARDIPLTKEFNIYYSKLLIEESGKKYLMSKSERIKSEHKRGGIGLKSYFYIDERVKVSEQFDEDLSGFDLSVAYQNKDTPEFIKWLEQKQVPVSPTKKIFIILIPIVIIIVLIACIMLRKIKH